MIILKQLEKKNKSIQIFPFVIKDDYLITKIPAIMQKRKKLGWRDSGINSKDIRGKIDVSQRKSGEFNIIFHWQIYFIHIILLEYTLVEYSLVDSALVILITAQRGLSIWKNL